MDSATPLQPMDPRPISSSQPMVTGGLPYRPASAGPDSKPRRDGPQSSFGITPSQIPDHPGSTNDVPRASNGYGRSKTYGPGSNYQSDYYHQDMGYGAVATQELPPRDIESLKATCADGLREYQGLCKASRKDASTIVADRTKYQRGVVLNDLKSLHAEVKNMIKEAENSRWRTWLIGGALASFIPIVRKIFRRGNDKDSRVSTNDTEYAFRRAKSFLAIIKNNIMGKGSIASVGMFIFAVLYLFQNEVTIRVAKTVQKRLKKLNARIESGDTEIDEKDIKLLEGWRWRVLLW